LYAGSLLKSNDDRPTDPLPDWPSDQPACDGKIVRKIRLILRAAVDLLNQSRTGRAVVAGVRATFHSFGNILHQLWLEVTGFTFLAIAGIGVIAGMREYGKYQAHAAGPGRLLLAICFTLSFAWFGLSSFWRVKRRSKS
jgi:hypothetical protein